MWPAARGLLVYFDSTWFPDQFVVRTLHSTGVLVSVEEVTILVHQVRFSRLDIECDTETRRIPNVDEATFHHRVRQPIDNVVPPLRLANRILESDVVLWQRCCQLNMRGEPYKPVENPVGSNEDAVEIGVFRDPLHFRQPADIFRVGSNNVDSLFFDKILEVPPEVNLFSGVYMGRSTLSEFSVGVRRESCDSISIRKRYSNLK
jgi:hypothetical protein